MNKIVTIVGARPQFIKAAAMSRVFQQEIGGNGDGAIAEVIVHTGQHFDEKMSGDFFSELNIPEPAVNLRVSGLTHGAMTGRMLESIEAVLVREKPKLVLIYGDTNSTLAGALAGAKLNIPVAHIEAGLRSFNLVMPEEKNRMVADVLSDSLFCPTDVAVENLKNEGRTERVYQTGDVMFDIALYYGEVAKQRIGLGNWGLESKGYVLATVHRAENTDHPDRLGEIVKAISTINQHTPVILPIHPRTRKILDEHGLSEALNGVKVVEPLGYLDMVRLEMDAKAILTDSGGVQKEAFFHRVPCITLRDETEWKETVESGWNTIVGANAEAALAALEAAEGRSPQTTKPYGDGDAAERILRELNQLYF